MANVIAVAFHKPEDLDKLFKPSVQELAETATKDDTAWETDEWWKSAN